MSDDKAGPQYVPTKQIPKVEVPQNTLDAVLSEVRSMRDEQKGLVVNVEVLTKHVDTLTSRVILVERRQDDQDTRGTKHSGGLVRASQADAQHDAAIAGIVTTQGEHTLKLSKLDAGLAANTTATLAMKTALVDEVKGFFKSHPLVSQALLNLALVAIAAATAWLAR